MAANVGNQKITLLFHTIANSLEVNKRHVDIRQKGIYKGGWLSIIDGSNAQISPLICEISDADYQVRAETQDAVNLLVSSGTPYIVLRWTYTGAVSDYMELLAAASPLPYDLVVGKCVFNGAILNGFNYDDSSYPRNNPNIHDMFLKVEETGDSDLRVRIRSGRIQTSSGNISIADQKSGLFNPPAANSKIYLVYVDTTTGAIEIDSSGTSHASPSPPGYDGKLVLAEITLASTSTSIPQLAIKDVRNFISSVSESPETPPNTITAETMRIEAAGGAGGWVQAKLTALQISQGWFCTGGGIYIPAYNDNQSTYSRPISDGSGWEGYNNRFGITVYAQCIKLTLAIV